MSIVFLEKKVSKKKNADVYNFDELDELPEPPKAYRKPGKKSKSIKKTYYCVKNV